MYLRLFVDFYQSDIIIASPLGLRLLMEQSGSKLSSDFLSSIEVAVLHQADVMYMQNWEHVEFILSHLNKLPEQDHGTDFSRIRPYFLEPDKAANHRQLIMTSQFNEPMLQASFRRYAHSVSGSIRLKRTWGDGCIAQVANQVKQVFQLIRAPSLESQENTRYNYFIDTVLSPILRMQQSRTLIVTPSYLHFIRVRNELMRRESNAVYVSEYSRDSEINRGRSKFYHGHAHLMLYSGRAHFFRRMVIRGVCHVIFYSLPEYAHFYPEIVNSLGLGVGSGENNADAQSNNISCLVVRCIALIPSLVL